MIKYVMKSQAKLQDTKRELQSSRKGCGAALHREERRGAVRAGAAMEETLPRHHAAQVPAPALVGRASGSDSQNHKQMFSGASEMV